MKTYSFSYILVLLLSQFWCINGWSQNNAQIAGRYYVDKNQTMEFMDAPARLRFDSLQTEIKSRVIKSLEGRIFEFKSNNEVEIYWVANGENRSTSGTWTFDVSSLLLVISTSLGSAHYYVEFRGVDLLITDTNPTGFFRSLYLSKQP